MKKVVLFVLFSLLITANAGDRVVQQSGTLNIMWEDKVTTETNGYNNGKNYCDNLVLGGYDDWRFPLPIELDFLTDKVNKRPLFSFQNMINSWDHITNTARFTSSYDYIWSMNFNEAYLDFSFDYIKAVIRCVRGTETTFSFSRDDNTSIVTESVTGIMYQDDNSTLTNSKTWENAKEYCSNLQLDQYNDWRLPSPKELMMTFTINTDIGNSNFKYYSDTYYWTSITQLAKVKEDETQFSTNIDRLTRCVRGNALEFNFTPIVEKTAPIINLTNIVSKAYTDSVINVNFSVSDLDGNITSYHWDYGDGNTSSLETFSYSYANPGLYTVTLTVTDNDGLTANNSFNIKVEIDTTPVITSLTYTAGEIKVNTNIDFNTTVTDYNNSTITYSWDFGDGHTSSLEDPTHSYSSVGVYDVTLTVTNIDDLNATKKVSVIVKDQEQLIAPVVSIDSNLTATITGTNISFTATATDSDGIINSYSWDFGDGSTSNLQSSSHTFLSAGSYNVTLTVTDDDNLSATATKQISITNPLQSPISSFVSSATAVEDTNVDFNATATDSDGIISTYSWDFGDGGTSNLQNASYKFTNAGTYNVSLTVTDNDGLSSTVTKSITVTNSILAPEIELEIDDTNAPKFDANITVSSGESIVRVDLFLDKNLTKFTTADYSSNPSSEANISFDLSSIAAGTHTVKVLVETLSGSTGYSEEADIVLIECLEGLKCYPNTTHSLKLEEGWSIVTLPYKTGNSSLIPFKNNKDVIAIFMYELGSWKWYVKNETIPIETITVIEWGRGYWIKATKDTVLTFDANKAIPAAPQDNTKVGYVKGWNLLGTRWDDNLLTDNLNNCNEIETIWVFRDNKWYNSVDESLTISPLEGFWLYSTKTDSCKAWWPGVTIK